MSVWSKCNNNLKVRLYSARTLGLQTSPQRLQLPQLTLLPPRPPSLLSLLQPPVGQLQPSPPRPLLLHLLHLRLEIIMDGPQAIGLSRSWTMNPFRRLATTAAYEKTSSSAGISTRIHRKFMFLIFRVTQLAHPLFHNTLQITPAH